MLSDQELIGEYRGGRKEALEELIARYLKPVYGFILRLCGDAPTAEDLTQETFLKCWKSLNSYKTERSFKTWLFTIAHHTTVDALRRKKTLSFSELENEDSDSFVDTLEDPAAGPDTLLDGSETAAEVQRVLAALPPLYREVLLLHDGEGMTFEEIGRVIKAPMNTVKSRYRRAVSLFKKRCTKIRRSSV